jgi:lysophospholipase L1-like esterase
MIRKSGVLAVAGRLVVPRRLLAVLVVFLLVGSVMPLGPLAAGLRAPLRVMALGNSITRGVAGSTDGAGYRNDLMAALTSGGHVIDMVGSQQDGSGFDNDHEGRNGWRANQVRDGVIGWLDDNPADVMLLHIGTNDIVDGQNVTAIAAEIDQILDNIDTWEQAPGNNPVWVVLARIINRDDPAGSGGSETTALNVAIQSMADPRVASGDNLVVVDMESALLYPADMGDTLHPNDGGYAKMAGVWAASVDALVSSGWPPDSTPPVISLVGADPQTIQQGDSYSELGATAVDDIDGDLTSEISIDASGVDTSTVGVYAVTYDLLDGAGNQATQVTRTVKVVAVPTTDDTVSTPPPPPAPPPLPPPPPPAPSFDDLGGLSSEAVDAINRLAVLGITTGTSETKFSPAAVVNRWQMALFLVRELKAAGITLPAVSGSVFTDIAAYDQDTQDAMNQLAALTITVGTGDGEFSPEGTVTRRQMALFLTRLLDSAGLTLPDATGATQFDDLKGDSLEVRVAVEILAKLGVAKGTAADTFSPEVELPRWQMAIFLIRVIDLLQPQ